MTLHNITLGIGNEEPPSKVNMGISAGFISADGALARRFKGIGALWSSDWGISPARTIISRRCLLISDDIQRG